MRLFSTLILLLGMYFPFHIPTGYAEESESEMEEESSETEVGTGSSIAFPTETEVSDIEKMELMASNPALELYFNEENAEFAVKEINSGHIWYSNPANRANDPIANPENKSFLSAQVALKYFDGNGQTVLFDTYKDSVSNDQFTFEKVQDGFKIVYTLGSESKGIEQIPVKISEERFHTLILDKISDEKDKKDFENRFFKYIEEEKVYERRDGAFSPLTLGRTLTVFEEVGYTEEDVAFDNAEHGGEGAESASYPSFTIPLLVELDGDQLVVTLDGEELEYEEQYPINEIQVLPFFGAADQNETGYILVPDGSGALIELNNNKGTYRPFSAKIYGRDEMETERSRNLTSEAIRLPVFGMKQGDNAFFGVVEDGDGIGKIEAEVSNLANSYNTVSSSFIVKESEEITLQGGEQSNTIYTIQKGDFNEMIKIRYAFLEGDDANYTGMANLYQEYLVEKHNLESIEEDSDIPFYLELSGAIWKRKTILGIPYRSLQSLTTFEQGEEIINELLNSNINNIKLRYTGWFNEGINHKIPTNIKIDRVLGGKKGFNEFHGFLQDHDVELYPDVALANIYRNTFGFSPSKDASRYITKEVAEIRPINPATYRPNNNRESYYLLSPDRLPDHVDGFIDSYEKLNLNSVSLRDLGDKIHSDFRETNVINREQSKETAAEQLNIISDKIPNILASGGNEFIFPYVNEVINVPTRSSEFNITDKTIPFYQMVIQGYIDHAGEPVNLSTDQNINHHILKSLETGSNIYFSWFYEDSSMIKDTEYNDLISGNYEAWLDEAVQMYEEVNSILKKVRGQQITAHKEWRTGVYETTYDNDYSVIVNYNNYPVNIDSITVEAENYSIR